MGLGWGAKGEVRSDGHPAASLGAWRRSGVGGRGSGGGVEQHLICGSPYLLEAGGYQHPPVIGQAGCLSGLLGDLELDGVHLYHNIAEG